MCLRTCAKSTDTSRESTKSHPGICSPFIHSIVSNDSVSGQAGLGFLCPHMPEDKFSDPVGKFCY